MDIGFLTFAVIVVGAIATMILVILDFWDRSQRPRPKINPEIEKRFGRRDRFTGIADDEISRARR